jgi:hypothetical protein
MKPVTDPNILAQLDGGGRGPVTDPAILAQLNGGPVDWETDVAKSAGANLGRGVIDVLGAPGDIGSLAARGAEAVGVPEGARKFAGKALAAFPLTRPFTGPGSQDIQGRVEEHTGKFYDAQTTPGKYVGSVARMAPAALVPGSMAQKVANVVVPGVASEAAGQATEGTAAEPYARAAAGLVGGAAASRIGRVNAATGQQAVGAAQERIANVLQKADDAYKSPAVASVEFRPGVADAFADTTMKALDAAKRNARVAPTTRAHIEDFKTPINGKAHTYEDFQTLKTLLGEQAGNFANKSEQAAASLALEKLKTYLGNTPQGHLSAGDAAKFSKTWRNANDDYAAGMTAQRVNEKILSGDRSASAANTGANSGNRTRQKLNELLKTGKTRRGLTETEGAAIEQEVKGSRLGNALRSMGDATGGGGGARSLVALLGGGGAGAALGLGPVGFALPFIGSALRGAGNAITKNQANKIVDQILSRAPSIEGIQQQGMQTLSDRKRRALIAQLGLAPMPIIKQPAQQPSN